MHDREGLITRLETARLVITPLAATDAAELVTITDHPSIIDRIVFLTAPFGVEQASALIAADPGFNGVRRKTDHRLIGVAGAHDRGAAVEIGYWIGVEFQRHGYAREAVTALIAHLGDTPIFAECHPDNRVSWQFLLSLGFHASGEPGRRPLREVLRYARAP